MSINLHVATKYQVEYGNGIFPNNQNDINQIILNYFPRCWFNEDSFMYSSIFEINRDDYIQGLIAIKEAIKNERFPYGKDLKENLKILNHFQKFLDDSDPDNDFIRLEWF